jgi:hypothetical protein
MIERDASLGGLPFLYVPDNLSLLLDPDTILSFIS